MSFTNFHTDTLHIISSFLPTRSLFPLRLVSKQWNQLLTSNNNNTWKILFERDFGNLNWFIDKWNFNLKSYYNKNYLIITLQMLEQECKDNLYFLLYLSVILSTPLQNTIIEEQVENNCELKEFYEKDKAFYDLDKLEDNEEENSDGSDEEEEDEDDEEKNGKADICELFYYFHLRLQTLFKLFQKHIKNNKLLKSLQRAIICDINIHRLGILFSIFDKNGLKLKILGNETNFIVKDLPKPNKQIKQQKKYINLKGQQNREAEERKEIQLECSYVMIGYEDDYEIIPLSKFSYAMLCGKEESLFTRMKEGKEGKETIAVSPYIQGPFTPFCFYLNKEFTFNTKDHPFVFDCTDILDLEDCDHFCPGFWNASFYWDYSVLFSSVYNEDIEMLKVSQKQIVDIG
ncbi:hypothetical protein ABK040_000805 [Willaertia magna]